LINTSGAEDKFEAGGKIPGDARCDSESIVLSGTGGVRSRVRKNLESLKLEAKKV
jgi:hypothetical protein